MKTRVNEKLKLITISFLCLLAYQSTFGQDSVTNDSTKGRLDIEIEKIISDPFYLLVARRETYIELEKSEVQILDPDWISKVDILTEDEKKKIYCYSGSKPLVLITLNKKRLKDYLDLIGK